MAAYESNFSSGRCNEVDCKLTEDEILRLEESYVPHALVGVMAQNKRENAAQKHVWSVGNQKIE